MLARDTNLSKRIIKISKIFDIDKILKIQINSNYIKDYYAFSKLAYRFLYSRRDFIHMGISKDGVFKQEDLERTIDSVIDEVQETNANNIFELACGRGANTELVHEKFPDKNYVFLDFSPVQIIDSIKKLSKYPNIKGFYSDFHQLELIKDESFDIIFIVEALCYAENLNQIASNAQRILRSGGRFIVIDGYYRSPIESYTKEQLLASRLIEIGMAVKTFRFYDDFKQVIENNGFKLMKEYDHSRDILPSLYKIEFLARGFFKFPLFAHFLRLILPPKMILNSISGYLMAISVEQNTAAYYTTVFEKL